MTQDRRQRRDVVTNHDRIVKTAIEILAEQGLGVDMRTIAAEAGVGIGTLYRHFPTREDLIREIIGRELVNLADSRLPAGLPANDALRQFFGTAIDHLSENRAMIDLLVSGVASQADLALCISHLEAIGEEALTRSKDDHTLANDITATDVAYQFLALVRVAQLLPAGNAVEIRHHVDLVLRGMESGQTSDRQ